MARHLIAIGIDNYTNPELSNLRFATHDAREAFSVFTDPNLGQFEADISTLLINPTKEEVERELEERIVNASDEDTFLVYFAGHGRLSQDYTLFLCAANTNPSLLISTAICVDNLQKLLGWSRCLRNIILLDCCYSGAVGGSFRHRGTESPNNSLESLSGRGKIIISGSGAWEPSREDDKIGHGVFTHYLLSGIRTGIADNDGDGLISCNDIFNYTYEEVTKNSPQEPSLWGLDIKGDIYLSVNPAKHFKNIKTDIDGRLMALIDEGEFYYGEENALKRLSAFYMDLYPVTNDEYYSFVKATGRETPNHWIQNAPPKGKENHPVVYVDYNDAFAFAKWAGKTLPTQEEWEKAARGNKGSVYPWGNSPTVAKTNVKENEIGDTTEVDRYKSGISPYGIYDMSGNIWEWCATENNSGRAPLRGSSFNSPFEFAKSHIKNDASINMTDNDTGFRCVLAVDKST